MGHTVPLLLSFPCNDYDPVAPVTHAFHEKLDDYKYELLARSGDLDDRQQKDLSAVDTAMTILEDLGRKSGANWDHDGGLHVWGFVTSFPECDHVENILCLLKPFFAEIFSLNLMTNPTYAHSVLLFSQIGVSPYSYCSELSVTGETMRAMNSNSRAIRQLYLSGELKIELQVQTHKLPFGWLAWC